MLFKSFAKSPITFDLNIKHLSHKSRNQANQIEWPLFIAAKVIVENLKFIAARENFNF